MQFGVCIDPKLLLAHQQTGDLDDFLGGLQADGVDYLELPVGAAAADAPDWERMQLIASASPLPIPAFMSFVPASHRITGPDVDLAAVLDFCRLALARCRALGGEVVVLGSAGARRVPPGFDHDVALRQFCDFGRALGPIAQDAGITIAIEPLSTQEDNLVTSVTQGAQVVDEIATPGVCLLADFYHMFSDSEPPQAAAQAGALLRHTHLADLGRVAPGFAPEGEADFVGFFRALRAGGYASRPDARCSFEGRVDDLRAQARPMMGLLRERWRQSEPAHSASRPQPAPALVPASAD